MTVLKDRYGNDRSVSSKRSSNPKRNCKREFNTKANQDLSHFLHQKVGDTLRTGPYNKVLNILTGRSKGRQGLFQRARQMQHLPFAYRRSCRHWKEVRSSVLQLKIVFPQTVAFGRRATAGSRKPVMVTVPHLPANR